MPNMSPALRKYVEAAEEAGACSGARSVLREIKETCRTVDDAIALLSGIDALWVISNVYALPTTRLTRLLRIVHRALPIDANEAAEILCSPNAQQLSPTWESRLRNIAEAE